MSLLNRALRMGICGCGTRIGCRISESGRSFSIQKRLHDTVMGVDLRTMKKPVAVDTCDAVFLVKGPNNPRFCLVFVELKGVAVSHALEQLENTIRIFCKKDGSAICSHHTNAAREYARMAKQNVVHLAGRKLVICVGRKGIVLRQAVRDRLFNDGVFVISRTGHAYSLASDAIPQISDGFMNPP